jgi:hypothetical protein
MSKEQERFYFSWKQTRLYKGFLAGIQFPWPLCELHIH